MKKVYITLAALLLIVATYFIYKYYFAINFEEVTVERTTENCEDNCFSVNLNYLKCKGASEFATNFNREIELQIANFLLCNDDDSLQIDDVSIEKALDNFLSDYNNLHEHFPNIPAYELTLTDSIMWQNDKMLSLISNRYSFTGGADAVQKKVYINFALDNGEVITNENLFTDEDKVLAIADKYFRIANDTTQVESLDGKGFDFEDGKFRLPKSIGVGKQGVLLFYEPFEIAPYLDVPFEVVIPMEEVEKYLTFSSK